MTLDVELRYNIIQKMSGPGNAQLCSFGESRGDTVGAYSGAREDSVLTQHGAVWVPTFRRAKLLQLQINPRREQPALSQQASYTRDIENKLSGTWVSFTCCSLHGVTCRRSVWAIRFLQQVQTCSVANPLPIWRVPKAPFLGAEVAGTWNWWHTWT